MIALSPEAEAQLDCLIAPRPYPALAKPGRRWIIEHSYWISYSLTAPPVISGVFYAMADIPNRI